MFCPLKSVGDWKMVRKKLEMNRKWEQNNKEKNGWGMEIRFSPNKNISQKFFRLLLKHSRPLRHPRPPPPVFPYHSMLIFYYVFFVFLAIFYPLTPSLTLCISLYFFIFLIYTSYYIPLRYLKWIRYKYNKVV